MKNIKTYLLLHALMLLFSLSPICSKLAGQYQFLSIGFLFFYGLVIVILGAYAVLWQQVIKRIALTEAYANKAITVVWGMVFGSIIFDEIITVQKLIGAAVIILGVLLFSVAQNKEERYE